MAGTHVYDSGIGGTVGGYLTTLLPLRSSVDVWYVHSGTGSDAASPRGKQRNYPLATLSQALTNATTDDIIVCLAGHTETLGASVTFGVGEPGITVIGEGTGSSRPKFTRNFNGVMFDIAADDIVLENLYFPASTTASAASRTRTNGVNRTIIENCYYECGANDTGAAYDIVSGSGSIAIRNTTFISTSTGPTTAPALAITVPAGLGLLTMYRVTFDGGASGWSNPFAFSSTTTAITRLRATEIDLLNDSDMLIHSGSTGYINVRNKSGSAKVDW
jgi:hypothetical protein